jgi:hypothetical protein
VNERGAVALTLAGVSAGAALVALFAAWPYRDLDYSCQQEAGPDLSAFTGIGALSAVAAACVGMSSLVGPRTAPKTRD